MLGDIISDTNRGGGGASAVTLEGDPAASI